MSEAASPAVLVVEDDAAINEVVARRLEQDGILVTAAFSGTEARLLLDQRTFDLVICDLMLPGMMGEDLLRFIRDARPGLPVIVISAKATPADKVELLSMGADDYLGKPFDLDELAARVQVQLRRLAVANDGTMAPDVVRAGRWTIDRAAHTLLVEGREVPLTRTEFNMAELLASHPGRVFTKQQLFEHAQGEPYQAQSSTVNAHISNLRAKLKPTGTAECIQTVWGIGFKFDASDPLKLS